MPLSPVLKGPVCLLVYFIKKSVPITCCDFCKYGYINIFSFIWKTFHCFSHKLTNKLAVSNLAF